MQNGGQTCISVERVYVEEPVYDELRRPRDREDARRCARACPAAPRSVDVGAMTSPPQTDLVDEHVNDAVEQGRPRRRRRQARRGPRRLLRADAAARRRPLDGVHDGGDLRPDPAGDEGRRRRRGDASSPTTPPTACRPRSGPRTPRRASSSRAGSSPASSASTTRSSTTSRWSCRWAAGRTPGVGSRHGAGGIRKYTKQQTLLVTRFAPTRQGHPHAPLQVDADDEAARPRRSSSSGVAASATRRRRAADVRRAAGEWYPSHQ